MITTLTSSAALVLLSEMGDKTQLLALVLAARFRAPGAVMAGILVATLANHGLAAWVGGEVAEALGPGPLRWIVGLSFLAFGAWMLVPDTLDDDEAPSDPARGAFLTTLVTFFIAEMGDKTQLVTVALGARHGDPWTVTMGTTIGMLIADGLAVAFGHRLTAVVPMNRVRQVSALTFVVLGIVALAWG